MADGEGGGGGDGTGRGRMAEIHAWRNRSGKNGGNSCTAEQVGGTGRRLCIRRRLSVSACRRILHQVPSKKVVCKVSHHRGLHCKYLLPSLPLRKVPKVWRLTLKCKGVARGQRGSRDRWLEVSRPPAAGEISQQMIKVLPHSTLSM